MQESNEARWHMTDGGRCAELSTYPYDGTTRLAMIWRMRDGSGYGWSTMGAHPYLSGQERTADAAKHAAATAKATP